MIICCSKCPHCPRCPHSAVTLQYSLRLWLSFFCLSLISALVSDSTTTQTFYKHFMSSFHTQELALLFWCKTHLEEINNKSRYYKNQETLI